MFSCVILSARSHYELVLTVLFVVHVHGLLHTRRARPMPLFVLYRPLNDITVCLMELFRLFIIAFRNWVHFLGANSVAATLFLVGVVSLLHLEQPTILVSHFIPIHLIVILVLAKAVVDCKVHVARAEVARDARSR